MIALSNRSAGAAPEERRSRLRGLATYAAGDLAWKGASLAALAIVARSAPDAHVDAVVLAATVFGLMTVGGNLGFPAIGTRLVALDPVGATWSATRRTVQQRRTIATLAIAMPVAAIAVAWLSSGSSSVAMMGFLAICWLPYFATLDWMLLGLHRYADLARAQAVAAACVVGTTAVGAALSLGAWAVGIGYATGLCAASLVGRHAVRTMGDGTGSGGHAPAAGSAPGAAASPGALAWRASAVLAAAFCLNSLFQVQEVLLTGRWLGTAAAAEFGAAHRIVFTAFGLLWLITQYRSPGLASAEEQGALLHGRSRDVALLSLAGGALGALLALGAGPLASALYGDRFPSTATTVVAMAALLPLEALAALFGTVLVMGGAGGASLATLAVGCIVSAAAFAGAVHGGVATPYVPVVAKYAGYLGLLAAQLAVLAPRRVPRR